MSVLEYPQAVRLFDPATQRRVMGQFSTGVAIISSVDEIGDPVGLTVGTFSSVSLEPPLAAFFVAETSATFPSIEASGRFCANILSADQRDLGLRFAKSGADKFAEVRWRPGRTGSPIIRGNHGWAECLIESTRPLGDHILVVGRIVDLGLGDDVDPLIFYRGGFHGVQAYD